MSLPPGKYTPEQVSEEQYGQPHRRESDGIKLTNLSKDAAEELRTTGRLAAGAVLSHVVCPECSYAVPVECGNTGVLKLSDIIAIAEGRARKSHPAHDTIRISVDAGDDEANGMRTSLVRALLSECVTVVKPGETLVIRVTGWTPEQADLYQEYLDATAAAIGAGFRVLVVIGDELGIADPKPERGAAHGG
jgi:hypothetical protein